MLAFYLMPFELGIVRSIDTLKGLLYVITPVPQGTLEKVDLLLQGFIQIPTCLLQVTEPILLMFLNIYLLFHSLSHAQISTSCFFIIYMHLYTRKVWVSFAFPIHYILIDTIVREQIFLLHGCVTLSILTVKNVYQHRYTLSCIKLCRISLDKNCNQGIHCNTVCQKL